MKKSVNFLFLLFAGLTLPLFAYAITVQTLVDGAEQAALYIAGGVVFILWIITGILFLQAQGDPGKLKSAKTALLTSVAGTLLVIIAGSAIAIIGQAFNIQ